MAPAGKPGTATASRSIFAFCHRCEPPSVPGRYLVGGESRLWKEAYIDMRF